MKVSGSMPGVVSVAQWKAARDLTHRWVLLLEAIIRGIRHDDAVIEFKRVMDNKQRTHALQRYVFAVQTRVPSSERFLDSV